ncbi:S9 family peptidase [Corallococcus sp. Z5C101001]|uniref:alpha/beta hydrolase family protein n=1 Tax=Corallococcus sp. Z5C101001 TaxID=2596829 RepID=UPI00118142E2|nr:alpha/beta fold hydrolase [Corallococcus sp. Z5C101001]TSC32847.1 alpha/beta fold hydrolase [Corallococcus sp. Z5C101001]
MGISLDRRSLIQASLGLTGGLALLRGAPSLAAQPPSGASASAGAPTPWYELGLMEDPIMESQLLHFLAATYSAQADISEVLDTARRVVPGDDWSWPNEWVHTADRIRTMGDASLAKRHTLSAGNAYLRAANYYRAALIHHPEPTHPSVVATGRKAVDAYNKALTLLRIPGTPVRIPYERTTLPGYFFRSPSARTLAPLLIFQQGRDAWPEESKYVVDAALARGYHCLLVHAPGQGMAIREQGLPFRPDWENVIRPVVDFAVCIAGVDSRRIALLGWSMGGALVPRAAAFERRIKILIPNPGVLNWGQSSFEQFNTYFPDVMPLLESDPRAFDAAMAQLMSQVFLYRWYMKDSMCKHGASSPSDLLFKLREFNNEPVVHRIHCRTLVMDGTAEAFSQGQARLLFDSLSCPKDYLLFTAEDTGLLHCQEGAQAVANHRMFDWLDDAI